MSHGSKRRFQRTRAVDYGVPMVEPPPTVVAPLPKPESPPSPLVEVMEVRVLAAIKSFDERAYQPRTEDISARLHLVPQSDERQALNEALTRLRKRGKLRYEHEFASGLIRWRLAESPPMPV